MRETMVDRYDKLTKETENSQIRSNEMTDEDMKVVDCMKKYGGSFVQALAKCFYRADRDNFEKLKTTFERYWNTYALMSKLDK